MSLSKPLKALHMFIGTSKSGKSFLMRYMLTSMLKRKQLKFGIVFTSSKHNGGYDWLPDKYVYAHFSMERLHKYLNFLKAKRAEGKKIPDNFIVLDDIINSIPQKSGVWQEFICTYRHYNITLLVTTQFITKCDPTLREQADFAYIFQLYTDAAVRAAYESYGQLFPTLKQWKAFLEKHAGVEHQCIVWTKESPPAIDKRYSTYKAPESKRQISFSY